MRGGHLTVSGPGCLAGTPAFMSPEQCKGEPLDARSDLYALGATYFTLLTGRPPYLGDTPVQVMFAHSEAPVPEPRSLVRDLPVPCAAIVRKALAKKPADRYASAAEMLSALLSSLDSSPATPQPARRPLRPILAGLAALALIAGTAWVALLGWPGREARVRVWDLRAVVE